MEVIKENTAQDTPPNPPKRGKTKWQRHQLNRRRGLFEKVPGASPLCGFPFLRESAAQSLYMPRAVTQAYKRGTRSPDGRPGSKYWQNRARYSITVTALPPDRTIRGTEQITYFNNSPDTLRNPVIKLFLNIHKPGLRGMAARATTISPPACTSTPFRPMASRRRGETTQAPSPGSGCNYRLR